MAGCKPLLPFRVNRPEHSPRQERVAAEAGEQVHAAVEARSGVEGAGVDDDLHVLGWCFDAYGPRAVAVKRACDYDRPMAVQPDDAPRRSRAVELPYEFAFSGQTMGRAVGYLPGAVRAG